MYCCHYRTSWRDVPRTLLYACWTFGCASSPDGRDVDEDTNGSLGLVTSVDGTSIRWASAQFFYPQPPGPGLGIYLSTYDTACGAFAATDWKFHVGSSAGSLPDGEWLALVELGGVATSGPPDAGVAFPVWHYEGAESVGPYVLQIYVGNQERSFLVPEGAEARLNFQFRDDGAALDFEAFPLVGVDDETRSGVVDGTLEAELCDPWF